MSEYTLAEIVDLELKLKQVKQLVNVLEKRLQSLREQAEKPYLVI